MIFCRVILEYLNQHSADQLVADGLLADECSLTGLRLLEDLKPAFDYASPKLHPDWYKNRFVDKGSVVERNQYICPNN